MDRDERLRLNDRILILTLFVNILLLVNQVATLNIYAQQSLQASMIPTGSGEALQVHVSTDTGRPRGIMDRVLAFTRDIRSSFSGTWIGSYIVGGVERENATVSISITVTGSNVASTATVDYWIEGRPSVGGEPYRFLEATGQSATVGGAALQASDKRSIEGHLQAMALNASQSQTVDYYLYVVAEATGAVSGETLTSEITETKFDTKEYLYGFEVEATYRVPNQLDDGVYVGSTDTINFNTDTSVYAGDVTSATYDTQTAVRFTLTGLPQGLDLIDARLKLYTYRGTADPTLTIKGEAADNATRVSSASDFLSRTRTTAYTTWPGGFVQSTSTWTTSPDIQAVVEEILNRPDWAPGNWLQLFVSDPAGYNSQKPYINSKSRGSGTTYAPALWVKYTSFEASWYPLPPLSLASLPITLDVVALAALFGAVALAWRENRRKMK